MDLFLILSTFGLGLRHGVDWDHLSAIADITGTELERRRAARLALLYALGHGAAVMALGSLAIVAGERLPDWIDPLMERVVGLTLVVLAVLLVRSLIRGGAPVSRGLLLFRGLKRTRERLRRTNHVEIEHHHPDGTEHALATTHVHAVDVTRYTTGGAVGVGLLHGIGAETGTQALVLVSAAHIASTAAALFVLGAFVAGIVVTTGALAIGAAYGWKAMSRNGRLFRGLTIAIAAFSFVYGAMLLSS
jgi:high-affinity nickel-transport protein